MTTTCEELFNGTQHTVVQTSFQRLWIVRLGVWVVVNFHDDGEYIVTEASSPHNAKNAIDGKVN
jgi:hypothetical protein